MRSAGHVRVRTALLSGDSGMTLLEVVISAAILFFALTALFSLVITTTAMSLTSNEKTVATNAINSYIEHVRSLQYEQVGLDTTSAAVLGELSAETTQIAGGYTLEIVPTVEWVDDPLITGTQDYKALTVLARVLKAGSVVREFSMTTYIRRETPSGDYIPPTIVYGSGSPADTDPPAVVKGSSVTVSLVAETTMTAVRIAQVSMYLETGTLLRDQFGNLAQWTTNAEQVTQSFQWDTLALNEDSQKFSEDGQHVITIEAIDTNQKRVFRTLKVVVDNEPPGLPGVPVPDVAGSPGNLVTSNWTPGQDGLDYADHYRLQYWRWDPGWGWYTYPTMTTGYMQNSHSLDTEYFGEYAMWVRSESPNGVLYSAYVPGGSNWVFFVSRPRVTGTYSVAWVNDHGNKYWGTTVDLALSAPRYTLNGAYPNVVYQPQQRIGVSGEWTDLDAPVTRNYSTAFTKNATFQQPAANENTPALVRYFRVKASFRTVWLTDQVLYSNVVGPTPTSAGAGAFGEGSW